MSELPDRPDLDQLRRQARELLRAATEDEPHARARIRAVSEQVTLGRPVGHLPASTASRAGLRCGPKQSTGAACRSRLQNRLTRTVMGEGTQPKTTGRSAEPLPLRQQRECFPPAH